MSTINDTLINEICDSISTKATRENQFSEDARAKIVSARSMLGETPINAAAIAEILTKGFETLGFLKQDGETLLNDAQSIKNEMSSPTGADPE